jgi:hypothetical protein
MRGYRLAAGAAALLLHVHALAVLPDAGPNRPGKGRAGTDDAARAARDEAAQEAQRRSMAQCLDQITEMRRTVAERCVMSQGTCYDKAGCELQSDGRYRCTTVNHELTARTRAGNPAQCQ